MSKNYDKLDFLQEWFCIDCDKSGPGGFPPALSHNKKTGHKVGVRQSYEYIIKGRSE